MRDSLGRRFQSVTVWEKKKKRRKERKKSSFQPFATLLLYTTNLEAQHPPLFVLIGRRDPPNEFDWFHLRVLALR